MSVIDIYAATVLIFIIRTVESAVKRVFRVVIIIIGS